jgi:hypothetical protein
MLKPKTICFVGNLEAFGVNVLQGGKEEELIAFMYDGRMVPLVTAPVNTFDVPTLEKLERQYEGKDLEAVQNAVLATFAKITVSTATPEDEDEFWDHVGEEEAIAEAMEEVQ